MNLRVNNYFSDYNIEKFKERILITSIQGNNVLLNFRNTNYFGFHYALFNSFKINDKTNNITYCANRGDFFLSKKAANYSLESMGNTYASVLTILVENSYLKTFFDSNSNCNSYFKSFFYDQSVPFVITNLTNNPKHEQTELEGIFNIFTDKETAPYLTDQIFLESLVMKIFLYINKYCISNKLEESYLITSIKRYITDNLATASLVKTAEYLNYDPTYISDLVKKETGQTFSDLLLNQRMIKAKELLDKNDKSLSEISKLTGYNQTSSFIRVFKNKYKVTPGDYKNNPTILN